MKKKSFYTILVVIVVLFSLTACGMVAYYVYQRASSGLFFEGTILNGYDISGMSAKEAESLLAENYTAPRLTILEDGKEEVCLTLEEMGYTLEDVKLLSDIRACLNKQNLSLLLSLFEGNTFEVEVTFSFDEEVFRENVSAERFADARISCTDAYMDFNGEDYFIVPETYGNEFDDADLQVIVKETADTLVNQKRPQQDAQVEVPSALYFEPSLKQTDEAMNARMAAYNSFCHAKLTHTFGGDETMTVDWDTIQDWIIVNEDGTFYFDEEAIYNYVINMAAKYDTKYQTRTFTTSTGTTVTFENNDYGYLIDQDGEFNQIIQDLYANTEITREPVYSDVGYSRNGTDDLNGNYVEVSITAQHLWLYHDGELVIETDVVTGKPTEDRETATGVFTIPYKASPFNLKGGGSNGWDVDVEYWMPFYDGQGLHDASWRTSFGGSIYQTDGSHGCVNLPTEAAGVIYETIDSNYPILLYK